MSEQLAAGAAPAAPAIGDALAAGSRAEPARGGAEPRRRRGLLTQLNLGVEVVTGGLVELWAHKLR